MGPDGIDESAAGPSLPELGMLESAPMGGSPWTVRDWSPDDRVALGEALTKGDRAEVPPRSGAAQSLDRLSGEDLEGRTACGPSGAPAAFVLARKESVALGGDDVTWLRLTHVSNAGLSTGLDRARPLLAAAKAFAAK